MDRNKDELVEITRSDNLESAFLTLSRRVPVLAVKLGREGGIAARGKERARSAGGTGAQPSLEEALERL